MSNVTLKDIYDITNRIEEKFDLALKDQEKRIRVIENFQSKTMGVVGVFAAFVSVAASYIWSRVLGIRQ